MAIIYSTIEKMRSIQHLAEHSRVWVYQANRFLSDQEIVAISNALSQFIESWNAHGASLYAGFEIISSRFVVLAVDEEKALASGCSIDKSVHFFQKIGKILFKFLVALDRVLCSTAFYTCNLTPVQVK